MMERFRIGEKISFKKAVAGLLALIITIKGGKHGVKALFGPPIEVLLPVPSHTRKSETTIPLMVRGPLCSPPFRVELDDGESVPFEVTRRSFWEILLPWVDGNVELKIKPVEEGRYTITACTEEEGVIKLASVVYDVTPPEVNGLPPKNGQILFGITDKLSGVEATAYQMTGLGFPPRETVETGRIRVEPKQPNKGVLAVDPTRTGNNIFGINVKDSAGNSRFVIVNYKYTLGGDIEVYGCENSPPKGLVCQGWVEPGSIATIKKAQVKLPYIPEWFLSDKCYSSGIDPQSLRFQIVCPFQDSPVELVIEANDVNGLKFEKRVRINIPPNHQEELFPFLGILIGELLALGITGAFVYRQRREIEEGWRVLKNRQRR